MNLKKAREYYADGVITGFESISDPLNPGSWLLVIVGLNERSWTFQTSTGEDRVFSKLETLVGQIKAIVDSPVTSMRFSF